MGNMREIRDRIKSINDIMKITNAMYLISSSKLKKAKKDLAATQPYFNKLLYAMRSILSRAPEDIDMRYFDRREEIKPEDRKVGYIVITADKGMCGSYNHNIIKLTEEKMAAMGIPEGTLPVGWWIGFQVTDADVWEKVKDGTYSMFSIEGKAERVEVNNE